MTIQKRSLILGSIFVVALALYGAARYYSPVITYYVVEQSLIQKAPKGVNVVELRAQFRAYVQATPDKKSQMQRLLRVSENLEKVQQLTVEQLLELIVLQTR